jgi:hypothetical protein
VISLARIVTGSLKASSSPPSGASQSTQRAQLKIMTPKFGTESILCNQTSFGYFCSWEIIEITISAPTCTTHPLSWFIKLDTKKTRFQFHNCKTKWRTIWESCKIGIQKHPLEYSHSWLSNYRLPTDCNEIYFRSQGDKPQKKKLWFEDLGQQQIRKSRILQWLVATRLKSNSYNSNQITFRYWEQKLSFKDLGGGWTN